MNARALTLATIALLGACAPDKQAPVDVVALVFDPEDGRYEPRQVTLATPTDIVAMDGPFVRFLGGAELTADVALTSTETEAIRNAMTTEEGEPVKVSYIERQGVLVPADFHSLNLVTSYYNLERGFDFFKRVGSLDPESYGKRDVFYFPELTMSGQQIKDNALYFSPLQCFMILPFEQLQQIPLALNLGVVGHELSHSIFNYRVFDSETVPRPYQVWYSDMFASPGLNLIKSLDEGLADVFGTGITCSEDFITCDLGFMEHSIPEDLAAERRLDGKHCMTEALWSALREQTVIDFSTVNGYEYRVGSVLSSSLWRAVEDAEVVNALGSGEARRQLFEGLYRALGDNESGLRSLIANLLEDQGNFKLESGTKPGVLEIIVGSIDDPVLKSAVCSAFLDRFDLALEEIKGCPSTARAFGDCP